jgi:hypothetical protein
MAMTRPHWDIPTEDDMTIPRWARIALAARTVRRVQPLLLASWPDAPKRFTRAVENAVAEAELAASHAAVTPDQRSAGMAGMDAYGSRPIDGAEIAGYVAYAAAHASFAASRPGASHASFVIEEAMWAVHNFEKYGKKSAPGVIQAALDAIWRDLRHLIKLTKAGQWTDKTPVDMTIFGPMWDVLPKQWPKVRKTPTTARRMKRSSDASVEKLKLPQDLVEFLKAGKALEYESDDAECGLVVLKLYVHLRLGECRVGSDGTSVHSKDPHRGEDGDYLVKAVELIGECDAYDPAGILTWFPDFRCYGCWDSDHHTALVFPKAKWTDIAADPAPYVGAQWNGPSDIAKHMTPWKHGEFKKRK